jgi:CspA family cold shock protein
MRETVNGTGTVKFFDLRGYGFIVPSNGGEDLYFHASELPGKRGERTIADGQPVSYEVGSRNGKPVAKKVVVLSDDEQPASEMEVGNGVSRSGNQ